jgi:signal recognition particle subunit SRP54
LKRNAFDLQDFYDQLSMLQKLGPLQNLLGMMPGMSKLPVSAGDEKRLTHVKAMISSMTPVERKRPEVLNARRRQRIAKGSGRSVSELNDLLRRFEDMKKMMSRLTRSGNPEQQLKQLLGRR